MLVHLLLLLTLLHLLLLLLVAADLVLHRHLGAMVQLLDGVLEGRAAAVLLPGVGSLVLLLLGMASAVAAA